MSQVKAHLLFEDLLIFPFSSPSWDTTLAQPSFVLAQTVPFQFGKFRRDKTREVIALVCQLAKDKIPLISQQCQHER